MKFHYAENGSQYTQSAGNSFDTTHQGGSNGASAELKSHDGRDLIGDGHTMLSGNQRPRGLAWLSDQSSP
jgi:hypothetical protein